MSSAADLRAKWSARQAEWRELRVQVDGERVANEILADLLALGASADDEQLSLAAAAAESGYSRDHLARLVRRGAIPNAGRLNAPRIRRGDLPRKAGTLPPEPLNDISRAQIARSVVTSAQEARHG